jgi:hypothetical protein
VGKRIASAALAVVVAASMFGFLALHAVKTRVATDTYFSSVLRQTDAYRRLYDELLLDPEFAPELDAMLGGVDVRRDQIIATVRQLVPPDKLEAMANAVVSHLVVHLDGDGKLDLAVDITPIVTGVHEIAINALVAGLKRVPVKEVGSFEEFASQLDNLVSLLDGKGTIPDSIPHFTLGDEQQKVVLTVLHDAAHLNMEDPEQLPAIEAMQTAIAADDVATAIRLAAGIAIERLIIQSIDKLTHNAYVTEVDGKFLFGPDRKATAQIESKLDPIRRADHLAGVGRVITGLLVLAGLAGLIALHRRDRRAMFVWLGGTLVAAGAVVFIGWLVAHGIVDRDFATVADAKTLPASFRLILGDVFRTSTADFTPSFWVPALISAIAGVVFVVASRVVKPSRAA